MIHCSTRRFTAIVLAIQFLTHTCAMGQSAPVADPGAAAGQKPLVTDRAANGTPIVNITAPTAGGVSRNQYRSFDVPAGGVILNNSAVQVNSQLAGGQIQGNPQLGATPARVILNQVTGAVSSTLAGRLEVAGSAADIVLANPAGITCTGCGFINTHKATLTTGQPVLSNGTIRYYTVSGGDVSIEDLQAPGVQLDVIGDTINLYGTINVAVLQAIAGTNKVWDFGQDLVATPQSSAEYGKNITIQPLANVQSGRIYMVADGGGVTNNGTLSSREGGITISALGVRLGVMESTGGDISLTTGSVSFGAQMQVSDALTLSARNIFIEMVGEIVELHYANFKATGDIEIKLAEPPQNQPTCLYEGWNGCARFIGTTFVAGGNIAISGWGLGFEGDPYGVQSLQKYSRGVSMRAGGDVLIHSLGTRMHDSYDREMGLWLGDVRALNVAGRWPFVLEAGGDVTLLSDVGEMRMRDARIKAGGDIFISGPTGKGGTDLDFMSGGSLAAGGDITVVSPDSLGFTPFASAVFGTIPGGTTTERINHITAMQAGGNVLLQSGQGIINLDGTSIYAGGDVLVSGQSVGVFGPADHKRTSTYANHTTTIVVDETAVTGAILAEGDVSILAHGAPAGSTGDLKGDVFTSGATIGSVNGHVSITAARDIDIANDVVTDTFYENYYRVKKKLFSTKVTRRTRGSSDQTIVPGTVFGNTVSLAAGHDLTVLASDIQATGSIGLHADHDLSLLSTGELDLSYSYHYTKKSGLFSGGGLGITIGSKSVTQTSSSESVQQTGASVSSLLGDVMLTAGNQYTQMSSEVVVPVGDVGIAAKEVAIATNNNTYTVMNSIRQVQTGLTVSISHPLVTAAQTVIDMGKASERTDNGHTRTLAALTSALTLYNVFNPVENVSSAGAAPKEADPKLSLNVSLGYSSSEYRSVYNEVTPSEVAIVAGGNISIQATGQAADEQGDINIVGAKLSAGRGLSLQAANDVNILAAKGTTNESSTTKADSAAIGVSYVIGSGGSGLSATLSASRTRGFTNGRGVEYMPTVLTAGASGSSQGRLSVSSGRHTGILGATLSGHEVVMEVGTQGAGDLTVASVQDSSFYEGQEKTTGVNVSIPINGGAASLGLNYSKLKLLADYQSAKEQTAIRAGAGGFDLWVQGDTVLKGAVIASTAEAGMNVLSTRSLLMQDLTNQANVSGRSDTLTLQYNKKADSGGGLQGHFGGSGYGTARIDRKTMGHTLAAISPAAINILNHDRQYERLYGPGTGRTAPATSHDAALNTARQKLAADQAALAGCTTDACRSSYNQAIAADQTQISSAERLRNRTLSTQYVASVRRDVNGAHVPVDADFVDPGKVTAELKTEVAVMVAFSKAGYQAAGTFSEKQLQKAREKLEDANRTTADPALQAQLRAEAAELQRLWGDSGPGRAALHALVGGSALGVAGAAASAGNVLAADYIDRVLRAAMGALGLDPEANPTLFTALKMTGSTVLGAAVGGANGAAAAFNADANNRQLHPEEIKLILQKRSAFAQRLRQLGYEVSDAKAEQILSEVAANRVNTSDMLLPDMGSGNQAFKAEAMKYLNEVGAQAGSFHDSRGYDIKYFTVTTTSGERLWKDLADQNIYRDLYNTVELQDFAWRTQGKNLIGSSPSPEAIENYLRRNRSSTKAALVTLGVITGGVVIAGAGPALTAAIGSCLANYILCANQAAIAAADVLAGDALGTAAVLGSSAAASKKYLADIELVHGSLPTGTVWDALKISGGFYQGTVVPKTFELTLQSGQKIWVDANATKHIAEYAGGKIEAFTPEAVRIASQAQISSLKSAVEGAAAQGIVYRQMIKISGWELVFAAPKVDGQFPALYHAVYKGQ